MSSPNHESAEDETKDWHETEALAHPSSQSVLISVLDSTLKIPFKSAQHADIARRVILVDRELSAHLVERSLVVEDNVLIATYRTATVRLLRLATNGFIENLQLVIRTIQQFAPPAELEQSSENVTQDAVAAGTTV
ncbi:hypothetical protein QFC20_005437 [Naganishia adeliensis]|uniref:Uncharacterized protein n=1 Tax=Naganishia adeliensis TaxID=92952 RepID=A0ACC2VMM6_9TREE|nr:hypothetical protein QFC20_005437 [Naganishia adeliensis]